MRRRRTYDSERTGCAGSCQRRTPAAPPLPAVQQFLEKGNGLVAGNRAVGPHERHLLALGAIRKVRSVDDTGEEGGGPIRAHGYDSLHCGHPNVLSRIGQGCSKGLGANRGPEDRQRLDGGLPGDILRPLRQLHEIGLGLPESDAGHDSRSFRCEHGIFGREQVHQVSGVRTDEPIERFGESVARLPVWNGRDRPYESRDGLSLQCSDQGREILRPGRSSLCIRRTHHLRHRFAHIPKQRGHELLCLVLSRLVCEELKLIDDQGHVAEVQVGQKAGEHLAEDVHDLTSSLLVTHLELVEKRQGHIVHDGPRPLGFYFALQIEQVRFAESDIRELR